MNDRIISSVVQPMMSCPLVLAVTTPSASRFSICTCPALNPATTNGECVVANICNPGKCSSKAGITRRCQVGLQMILDLVNQQDGRLFIPSVGEFVMIRAS